jgi:hypothetical protein
MFETTATFEESDGSVSGIFVGSLEYNTTTMNIALINNKS